MRIEKAIYQDIRDIADIEQSALHNFSSPSDSEWQFKFLLPNTYVAKIGSKVVGFVTLAWHLRGPDQGAWVDMIAINKAYRHRGIGRLLVQQAMQEARQRNYNVLFVGSYKYYRAKNFYLKLGFKIIRESHDDYASYRDFSISLT